MFFFKTTTGEAGESSLVRITSEYDPLENVEVGVSRNRYPTNRLDHVIFEVEFLTGKESENEQLWEREVWRNEKRAEEPCEKGEKKDVLKRT